MPLTKPNLTKPKIGGDPDVWGDKLNKNIDLIDSFNKSIVVDGARQDEELSRLENEKISKTDLDTLVKNVVDNYVDTVTKPDLGNHVDTVNKVELKNYVDSKKGEIDSFTESQKVELNEHEKLKEGEFDEYIAGKIGGIDSHVESKKDEINTFTEEQKVELDAYEKVKEGQLESFKDEKKVEITSHTDAEIERINATGVDGKQDKTDNALETKDKTVVGAINELLSEKENLITRSNAINSESTTDVATSKAVNDLRLEVNKKTINAGDGLATTIDVGGGQTISITPKNESILVDNDSIWVNIVNDFTTGGVNKVASAESIKVLKQLIDTLGGGGATKLLRASEALGEYDYIGNLPSGGISITVGTRLFNPTLYLDGVRMEENRYSVEFETGLITLNEAYADYEVVWVVEDKMPYHVTFCFPTMNLLLASEDIKSRIKLGNVIKILGEFDEDDGGHYLVKCEDTSKLNAVDIGEGRFLNEIPNTRISDKVSKKGDIINGTLVATDFVANNYFKIKDYYGTDRYANIWYNNQREGFSPKTLYVYDAENMYLGGDKKVYHTGYKPTANDVGAMPITGGTFTGNVEFPNGKVLVTSNNYGIMGKRTDGSNRYILLVDTANRLSVGWDNKIPIFLASTDIKDYNSNPVFTGTNCPRSLSERGYAKFANGLIIQWGKDKVTNANASNTIYYPIAFSSMTVALTTSNGWAAATYGVNAMCQLEIGTPTTFQASSPTAGAYFMWIAIGW